MPDSRSQRLAAFTDWASQHITGDEKGEAHIFLDRLFQAFGQPGCLDVGGHPEFRIRKGKESTGGTSFADYVWRPTVLIEMKKRGEPLARHLRQALDYWFRINTRSTSPSAGAPLPNRRVCDLPRRGRTRRFIV